MGDWYEVKELANDWYLEFQSAETGWNPKAVKLTHEQAKQFIEFEDAQAQRRYVFLKQMAGNLK